MTRNRCGSQTAPNYAMEEERSIEEIEEFLLEQEAIAEEDDGINPQTGALWRCSFARQC